MHKEPVTPTQEPAAAGSIKAMMQPILAVDQYTNEIWEVTPIVEMLQHSSGVSREEDQLHNKIDKSIQQVLFWADPDADMTEVKMVLEMLFRLRDAFRECKIHLPEGKQPC